MSFRLKRLYSLKLLGAVLLLCSMVVIAKEKNGRSAEVDCRAGCQGNEKGCQESYNQEARLDSQPGKYFDFSTLKITSYRNADGSPGLRREPKWTIVRVPHNASHPTSIIIAPVVSSCEGVSPHTQGVTFYTWSAEYFE